MMVTDGRLWLAFLTFSLGMVLDMSAGLIIAGTPPRKDTAALTNRKLLFSLSRSSLNSNTGESGTNVRKTTYQFKHFTSAHRIVQAIAIVNMHEDQRKL